MRNVIRNRKRNLLLQLTDTFTRNAGRNAFCIDDTFFTYQELINRIGAIRVRVRETADTHVGLVANDDIETYASIFALWMEGRSYVPLHPLQPLKRCEDIIAQVGLHTILDSSEETRYSGHNVILTRTIEPDGSAFGDAPLYEDDHMAYILFTSGSTGHPKGVCITMGNVAAFADAFADLGLQLGTDDRCLQMFDLTFDMSVGSYLMPLLSGACVYTVKPGRIKWQAVFSLMERYRLTEAQLVPSVIHYLRPYMDEINAPEMRYCFFAGEGLPLDDVLAWQRAVPNAEIWNVYGPTENTVYSTGYRISADQTDHRNGIVSIGQAMRNVSTLIAGPDGQPLPAGQTGELYLAGDQLTPGYWHDEAHNAAAFVTVNGRRWYRTGDLCELTSDGVIRYCGRLDSQVQVQGYRVELGEIEHVARQFFSD